MGDEGGRQDTREDVTTVVQLWGGGGRLAHEERTGWIWAYALKVKLTEFADSLDVGWEERCQGGHQGIFLDYKKNGVCIYSWEKLRGKSKYGRVERQIHTWKCCL